MVRSTSLLRRGLLQRHRGGIASEQILLQASPVCPISTSRIIHGKQDEQQQPSLFANYVPPETVQQWEKTAEKELSRSKTLSVDHLRTQRLTPEGIAIQPVYYDLNNDNKEPPMPGTICASACCVRTFSCFHAF